MAENFRELDLIQTELDRLHERSQNNKANISAHEAVCEERYAQIMSSIAAMHEDMQVLNAKLDDVTKLATQGKTSLATLLWVGGAVASIAAFLVVLQNLLPK